MGWHDMDVSDWAWMTTMMITFWGVIITGVVLFVRRGGNDRTTPPDTPEAILQHRLARGEIDVDEYNERLNVLRDRTRA